MARYAAFLRGIMPSNARMSQLKSCFEAAGFSSVKTLLSSGNVVFEARASAMRSLERRIEAAMQEHLGQGFMSLVRSADELQAVLDSNPYGRFRLASGAKRVVTFLRVAPRPLPMLPLEHDGARILSVSGREVFSAYLPSPRGPVFMSLIGKTFGKEQTTRTWDTVAKVAAALQARSGRG
jgi:uncharacterized protein (DUF1697 family)